MILQRKCLSRTLPSARHDKTMLNSIINSLEEILNVDSVLHCWKCRKPLVDQAECTSITREIVN